ncbi:MAG: hypothetical protein H8D56_14730 [Planctomycetes bacterium]|nr:hypothetical protein [Planctomycetota bacterium]MBL7145284.1 hypothetical protein [Phycisphaerae bacterium]
MRYFLAGSLLGLNVNGGNIATSYSAVTVTGIKDVSHPEGQSTIFFSWHQSKNYHKKINKSQIRCLLTE